MRKALETDFLGQDDPEFDPRNPAFVAKAQAAIDAAVALVATKTTAEWMEIFEREGVPAGPVQFPEDMSTDPQVLANEMIIDLEHDLSGPQQMVAPILKFSATPAIVTDASPPLGRDTEAYLREAGYSDGEIEELRAAGVVA